MRFDFDLAVVGGGPAGAAGALEGANLGLRVALFDPQLHKLDKPCGEGILPAGVDALAELGLSTVLSGARRFERLRYRVPGSPPVEIPLPRPGLALPRPDLQRALTQALERRRRISLFDTRVETALFERGFLLRLPGTREGTTLSARTLIAADGTGGRAAGWLRPPGFTAERSGMRARFEDEHGTLDAVEVHLGHGCEVYLTPLPHGLVNAAFLFDRTPPGVQGSLEGMEWALERHPAARAVLGRLVTRPEQRPLARRRPDRLAQAGVFLTGDAAGGVDPIVGCGITIALQSGVLAGRAAARVVRGAPDGLAERTYVHALGRETRLRRVLAWSLRKLAASPLLLRGAARLGSRAPLLMTPLVHIASGGPTPRPLPR